MNWIIGLTVTRIESFLFDDLILLLRFVYRLRSLSYSVVFMRTNSHGIDQGKRFSFIYDTPSLIIVIKTPPVPEIEIQKITLPQEKFCAFLSVGDLQKYLKKIFRAIFSVPSFEK